MAAHQPAGANPAPVTTPDFRATLGIHDGGAEEGCHRGRDRLVTMPAPVKVKPRAVWRGRSLQSGSRGDGDLTKIRRGGVGRRSPDRIAPPPTTTLPKPRSCVADRLSSPGPWKTRPGRNGPQPARPLSHGPRRNRTCNPTTRTRQAAPPDSRQRSAHIPGGARNGQRGYRSSRNPSGAAKISSRLRRATSPKGRVLDLGAILTTPTPIADRRRATSRQPR